MYQKWREQSLRRKIFFATGMLFLVFACGILCRFIRHEYQQNEKINELNAEIKLLYSELESRETDVAFSENTYNYLAIGNSITLHDTCNFWWSECGMAASKTTEDYFHKLCMELRTEFGDITAYAYNFSVWEIMAADRAETLPVLDAYLSNDLDLVTVQLGENVHNLDDYEEDYKYLLEYISDRVSDQCEIIVIGDFWEWNERDCIKQKICSGGGINMSI